RRGAGSRLGLELEPDPTLLRAKGSARQPLRLPLPVKPWPAVAGRTIFLFRTSELRAGCFSFFSLICPRIRGAPPFVFGRVGSFPSVLSFVLESGVPRPSFLEGWGLFLLFCHLSPNPGCPALRFWKGGVFSFCSVICPRIRGAPPFVFGRVGSFPSVLSFVPESGVPRPSFLEGWGLFLLFCNLSPNPGCSSSMTRSSQLTGSMGTSPVCPVS